MPGLICPSDPQQLVAPGQSHGCAITCYASASGNDWWSRGGTNNADVYAGGVFAPQRNARIASITDGTSNTIAVAEVNSTGYANNPGIGIRINGAGKPRGGGGDAVFRAAFIAGSFHKVQHQGGMDLQGRDFVWPDGSTPTSPDAWFRAAPHLLAPYFTAEYGINTNWPGATSLHVGGVQVLMADGAVRFVNQNLDWMVWNALNTHQNGEVVGEF
ncbi:DUF1559 domain-containing protein [Planctomicrobium sp. SH668]|uniref:DUF1559 family PulG-like putative transporter n=1 Tax=Planctomicrobium sp. SH668 TaxID=3448126 RepID=UPI003F5B97F2